MLLVVLVHLNIFYTQRAECVERTPGVGELCLAFSQTASSREGLGLRQKQGLASKEEDMNCEWAKPKDIRYRQTGGHQEHRPSFVKAICELRL